MQQRKNDDETKFVLYRNGHDYPDDISGCVFIWQAAMDVKNQAKYRAERFVAPGYCHIG